MFGIIQWGENQGGIKSRDSLRGVWKWWKEEEEEEVILLRERNVTKGNWFFLIILLGYYGYIPIDIRDAERYFAL